MSEILGQDETGAESFIAPTVEQPTRPQPAKIEKVMTPEEREQLREVVNQISIVERGNYNKDYTAENMEAADFVTKNSLDVVEARGFVVPTEYLQNVHQMIEAINQKEGVILTMNSDVLSVIQNSEPGDLTGLYAKILDIQRPFAERGTTPPPPESEISDFLALAKEVIDGREQNDQLSKVAEFKTIMFDVEGTRREKDGTLPADDIEALLLEYVSDMIEKPIDGVDSLTSEDLIAMTYANLKKKKVPASWAKTPRDIRTNIELAVSRTAKEFKGKIEVHNFGGEGDSNVGPIITFIKEQEK